MSEPPKADDENGLYVGLGLLFLFAVFVVVLVFLFKHGS